MGYFLQTSIPVISCIFYLYENGGMAQKDVRELDHVDNAAGRVVRPLEQLFQVQEVVVRPAPPGQKKNKLLLKQKTTQ